MALSGMRGLSVFISDIRNCQNKEQERLRVDKELGNVRTRFKNEKVRADLYLHNDCNFGLLFPILRVLAVLFIKTVEITRLPNFRLGVAFKLFQEKM